MAPKVTESVSFYLGHLAAKQPNIILQGDATTTEGKLRLTKVNQNGVPGSGSLGRALHVTPVHIWNSETNKPASFFTCFSFTIHAQNVDKTADGLAFFLAPLYDQPRSGAGFLGIFNKDEKNPQQVVAVEFDTYINKNDGIDDPDNKHIGIDVMSITSTDTVRWELENDSDEAIVYISYDVDKTLKATLVYPETYPDTGKYYQVSSVGVNLIKSLPEWVSVGFSAYAGEAETHDVNSWYFSSSFGDNAATLAEPLKKDNQHLAKYLNLHFDSAK